MRDGGGESGAQLLVGGQDGQLAEEEDERVVDVAHPPAGRQTDVGSHHTPLAVQDDDGLVERADEGLDARYVVVHHPFTSPSPLGDPSLTGISR